MHKFVNSITEEKGNKSLVFIIDELDRCRPNYSIEVLEKAKHFFNVKNIVFVLGADKTQLASSFKAIYGEGFNVNGYLRRFIDYDYLLPLPSKELYVNALFKRYDFEEYFSQKTGYEDERAQWMFEKLFNLCKLTLREQDYCCSQLNFAIRTTPKGERLYPLFLCFLIVLKVKIQDTYNALLNGEIEPSELLTLIKKMPEGNEFLETNYGTVLEAYIVTCKYHENDDSSEKYEKSVCVDSEIDTRSKRILKIIGSFWIDGGSGRLGYLLKKIEIILHFKS